MNSEDIQKELHLVNARLLHFFSQREKEGGRNSGKIPGGVWKKISEKHMSFLQEAFVQSLTFLMDPEREVLESVIEREKLEETFHRLDRDAALKDGFRALDGFSREAEKRKKRALSFAALEGAGLGSIGVGSPEAVLLCTLMLRQIYETAILYGINISHPWEKELALLILSAAFSSGKEASREERKLLTALHGLESGETPPIDRMKHIAQAAGRMSKSLGIQKLIQGIPLVGISGMVFNTAAIERLGELTGLVYRQRYLAGKLRANGIELSQNRKGAEFWNNFVK